MVTEYLLENGANANVTDKLGVTPLIAATRKGQRDVVAVLLQHGADVNAVSLEVRTRTPSYCIMNILHILLFISLLVCQIKIVALSVSVD